MVEKALGLKVAIVSRGRDHTALDRARYQLEERGTDIDGDKEARGSHRAHWMLGPAGAPAWVSDAHIVWENAARAERQWDAQEARILDVQIPRGLPRHLVPELVDEIYRPFVDGGLVVQVDYHVSMARDGGENPHLHGMISMRRMTSEGFAKTKTADRHWNGYFRADKGRAIRRKVADAVNRVAERHGCGVRVVAASNAVRDFPTPEPRLPRGVFLASGTKYAQKALSILDARRERRREWEEAFEEELEAIVEAKRLTEEVAAIKGRLPSIRPAPETAMFPDEVLYRAVRWSWIEYHAGESIEVEPIGQRAVAIRYDDAELIIGEDSLFIDGPVSASMAKFAGRLVGAVGWDMAIIGGEITQQDAMALKRATRSLADPISYQIRQLECEPLVADLLVQCGQTAAHEVQMILDEFCVRRRVSPMTRDILSNLLRDDWSGYSENIGMGAWKIFRAKLELGAIATDLSIARIATARRRAATDPKVDPTPSPFDPSSP